MQKMIYKFGDGQAEGSASMKEILGGKGANLAEMCNLGFAVPAGFTIATDICNYYYAHGYNFPSSLASEVEEAIKHIEKIMGAQFGSSDNPLLVSVRSGARASMPGMMDTILNLGLNDLTIQGLIKKTGNLRFAYDSYRRFIQMYSDVVLNIDHYLFEECLENKKMANNVLSDTELSVEAMQELVAEFKQIVKKSSGGDFPQDAKIQLWGAIEAVFRSWMNPRAETYRNLHNIPASWGTAVNIQAMVFGNMGNNSATGVMFTRDPSTGNKSIYGEYLINAQGEDVVAGIRTPQQITLEGKRSNNSDLPSMEETLPNIFQELAKIARNLELHYRDMQDIEFTVQEGKLWLLQTRSGKRTAKASVKIAVDMVQEGLISKEEALMRVNPSSLDQLLHPTINQNRPYEVIGRGLPASPGAASGILVFSAEEAERLKSKHKVILARIETSPEDINGMIAAEGILTARGGMTSHAAVVARGMGKPCVCGASNIVINYQDKTLSYYDKVLREGDKITINGSTGEIILGEVETIDPEFTDEFLELMSWADEKRTLKVRANAETERDAKVAKNFGAEGIGLCRTEHMFFDDERIIAMREMIVARSKEDREKALAKLLPMQRADFVTIFRTMAGKPVTIRLLDPPLHEFLPHTEEEIKKVAEAANISIEEVKYRSYSLQESNPMLGHRGCRLAITYPEIYAMQAKAIFEACELLHKENIEVIAEIMIPLVLSARELEIIKRIITQEAEKINSPLNYKIGTMIELPRAALCADEIAEEAEFFSFGTNDLTQTTCGISRDDSGSFIEEYKAKQIFDIDPFVRIDEKGVGELVKIAIAKAKTTRNNIKLGICGEHGGNPASIQFFHVIGLEYVSCSPYRVPIARLAAAQAVIMTAEETVA